MHQEQDLRVDKKLSIQYCVIEGRNLLRSTGSQQRMNEKPLCMLKDEYLEIK